MADFDLIVIGGGAAGFFGAICACEKSPGMRVLILEKSTKLLSKVRVSGGGRCNVTHNCFNVTQLSHHYPRGEKPLKNLFRKFSAENMVAWLKARNVVLKTEDDGRMFPITDSSQTIIDCFIQEASRYGIKIEMSCSVEKITTVGDSLSITCENKSVYSARHVLVATGGNPKASAYDWLAVTGHNVVYPIPSLFTFNDKTKEFTDLMGLAVPNATVKIAGTKFTGQGPVLITHWGLSGPAVIKLSAWAAKDLFEKQYVFTALVNWTGNLKEEDVRVQLLDQKNNHGKQKVFTNPLFNIPQRLWQRLCQLSETEEAKVWMEMPQKNINRLLEFLIRCPFNISGKTTFKEEFVTCGGVDLNDVDSETMESRKVKNLFFAGEVLNIDGETGGFNFQGAWTTAFVAAQTIASRV